MSHRVLLMQRLTDAIEAGAYRAKGAPRPAKDVTDAVEDAPAPMPRAEPAKRLEAPPEQRRGTPDPASFVEGLAARRRIAVGDGVQAALDAKFKGKR